MRGEFERYPLSWRLAHPRRFDYYPGLQERELQELLEQRRAAVHEALESQGAEEALRRAQESTRRALAQAERAFQRMPRDIRMISSGWGTGCGDYGSTVLGYALVISVLTGILSGYLIQNPA